MNIGYPTIFPAKSSVLVLIKEYRLPYLLKDMVGHFTSFVRHNSKDMDTKISCSCKVVG